MTMRRQEIHENCRFKWQFKFKPEQLTTEEPIRPIPTLVEWIEENIEFPFKYVWEKGELCGIQFMNGNDAMKYKMTWY